MIPGLLVRRLARAAVLPAALALVTGSCLEGREPRRPNVLLLVTDDQRPDTYGAAGNAAIRTPHLDELARRGLRFTRAVSPNPICTPARAELMSGCSGFRTGYLDFGTRGTTPAAAWAEHFRAAGYHTCYIGKWHNQGRPADWGYVETRKLYAGGGGRFAQPQVDWKGQRTTGYVGWVFQSSDGRQLYPEQGVGLRPDISADFVDAAVARLAEPSDEPLFVHVNFTAPHDPLLIPPGYEQAYAADRLALPGNYWPEHPFDHGNFAGRDELLLPWPRDAAIVRGCTAAYYAVASHLDAQLGRLLAHLDSSGQAAHTLILFTSDHGAALGSHGLRGKQNMYEHTIGVPLVVAGPGVPAGRVSQAQVYLRDLFPTCAELAGLELPAGIDGQSFAAVVRGTATTHHAAVFGYFRDRQRMIRTDRWKLIHYPQLPRFQLFDLQNDPLELRDLAHDPRWQDEFVALRQQLVAWQRSVQDPALDGP